MQTSAMLLLVFMSHVFPFGYESCGAISKGVQAREQMSDCMFLGYICIMHFGRGMWCYIS